MDVGRQTITCTARDLRDQTAKAKFSEEGLPNEILQSILSYLPPEQIRVAAQVSKRWRSNSVFPLQSAYLRSGLRAPAHSRPGWLHLQATRERVANRWKGEVPGQRLPTAILPSPDRSSYSFYDGDVVMSADGAYVRGVQSVYIKLPQLGEASTLTCRTISDNNPNMPGSFFVFGLGKVAGFVKAFENRIELYGESTAERLSVAPLTSPVRAAHGVPGLMTTAHSDGVRIWSLPSLTCEEFIQTGSANIESVEISEDGSRVLSRCTGGQKLYLWQRGGRAAQQILGSGAVLDNVRRHVLVYRGKYLTRYEYDGRRVSRRKMPDGHSIAFSEKSDCALVFDSDSNVLVVNTRSNDKYRKALVAAGQLADVEAIGISWDGRWIVGLCSNGDIALWDQESAACDATLEDVEQAG